MGVHSGVQHSPIYNLVPFHRRHETYGSETKDFIITLSTANDMGISIFAPVPAYPQVSCADAEGLDTCPRVWCVALQERNSKLGNPQFCGMQEAILLFVLKAGVSSSLKASAQQTWSWATGLEKR